MAVRRVSAASQAPAPEGVPAEVRDRAPAVPAAARTAPGRPGNDGRAEVDFALNQGLAGYVRAVAGVLRVSTEATAYEVSDTATAYLALNARSGIHPDRDLMLVWTERHGWALAVETAPTEPPALLAYLGADPVPEPAEVARFVDSVLADPAAARLVEPRIHAARHEVGTRLARYVVPRSSADKFGS